MLKISKIKNLRALMSEAHVSIYQVGASIGVHGTTIYKISVGEMEGNKHLKALSDFFACDIQTVIDGKGRYNLVYADGSGMVSVTNEVYEELKQKALIDVVYNGQGIERVLKNDNSMFNEDARYIEEHMKSLTPDELKRLKSVLQAMFGWN